MFGYLAALIATNLRAGLAKPGQAAFQLALMAINNLIFFVIWALYFQRFPDLRGWGREDMATLYGIVAFGFGLTMALAGGVRDMARTIIDGGLDVHLGRPRHPLPSLLMSRSIPSGLGDAASSLVLWLWLGGKSLADLPLLIGLSIAGGIVMLASIATVQCIVFWWPQAQKLAEQFWEVLVIASVYPQHIFAPAFRVLLFTLIPVAFMSQVPAEAVREADPWKALLVIAAAAAYAAIAVLVFNQGLKHYASGNRMTVNR